MPSEPTPSQPTPNRPMPSEPVEPTPMKPRGREGPAPPKTPAGGVPPPAGQVSRPDARLPGAALRRRRAGRRGLAEVQAREPPLATVADEHLCHPELAV